MKWLEKKIVRIINEIFKQSEIELDVCSDCEGSGVIQKCRCCKGAGVVEVIDHSNCTGGYYSRPKKDGRVLGPKYDGNYMIVGDEVEQEEVWECSCYKKKQEQCPVCKGTGKTEEKCSKCRGTGITAKFVFKGSQ
jgi:DnaJ-class molecular chaperone